MEKALILMRHGAYIGENLLPVGKRQIQSTAKQMIEGEMIPDLILYSPADRTRQTAHLMQQAIQDKESGQIPCLKADWLDENQAFRCNVLSEIAGLPADKNRILLVSHDSNLASICIGFNNQPRVDTIQEAQALAYTHESAIDWQAFTLNPKRGTTWQPHIPDDALVLPSEVKNDTTSTASAKIQALFNGIGRGLSVDPCQCEPTITARIVVAASVAGILTSPSGAFNTIAGALLPSVSFLLSSCLAGPLIAMKTEPTKRFNPDFAELEFAALGAALPTWYRRGYKIGKLVSAACIAAPPFLFRG